MVAESIRIDADISEITADVLNDVAARAQAFLNPYTSIITNDASYSVGTSADNLVIAISAGGAVTADWSFRIIFDTGLSNAKRAEIYAKVWSLVLRFTVDSIEHVALASHVAGNGTFQYESAVT